jgi:uncharacterized protein
LWQEQVSPPIRVVDRVFTGSYCFDGSYARVRKTRSLKNQSFRRLIVSKKGCAYFIMTQLRIYDIVYTTRLSWDEPKSRSNQRTHGIGFDVASRVFLDPLHLSRQDRIVEGEERWQTIGMVSGVLLILVAYTVVDEREEVLRIISTQGYSAGANRI